MNDLKFALRQLRKNPGFTAVAVLTLALGIGANTAIFTLINALVLRSLHVPAPDRFVRVTAWRAPADDRADAPQPVAVISHALWERSFGANPEVIGRAIQLDTVPFTIVGVMPAGFSGIEVDGHADLWWPLQMLPQVDGDARDLVRARPEAGEWLTVFGRLKSGVARDQARA